MDLICRLVEQLVAAYFTSLELYAGSTMADSDEHAALKAATAVKITAEVRRTALQQLRNPSQTPWVTPADVAANQGVQHGRRIRTCCAVKAVEEKTPDGDC